MHWVYRSLGFSEENVKAFEGLLTIHAINTRQKKINQLHLEAAGLLLGGFENFKQTDTPEYEEVSAAVVSMEN